jgi:DNA polymerase III subunit gamma/tau
LTAPPKEEVVIETDTTIRDTFSLSNLKSIWNEYASRMKREKKDIEYVILSNRELELDGFTIKIKLDNLIQIDQLNGFKTEFVEHLRKSLKNNLIMLEASISASEAKKVIYTSDEKFKHLLQKYPILEDLKKRLGLETDF